MNCVLFLCRRRSGDYSSFSPKTARMIPRSKTTTQLNKPRRFSSSRNLAKTPLFSVLFSLSVLISWYLALQSGNIELH